MTQNYCKLRIPMASLIYAVICIPCLEPQAIQNIPQTKLLFNIWRVAAFIMVVLYAIIQRHAISYLVLMEGLFSIILGISTILGNGNIISCISTTMAILTITIISEIGIKKNAKQYLNVLSITYSLILVIDTFQIFSGIGFDATSSTSWLGGDNFAIFAVLPMLGIIIVNSYLQNKRITPLCGFIAITTAAAKFYTFAGSSMIALALWISLIFVLSKIKCAFRLKTLLLLLTITIGGIVCFNFRSIFMAVSRALGKATVLEHSRLVIWQLSIQAIIKKPFLGYGVMKGIEEMFVIAGEYWATCSHTHNYFLELLFRSGVIGTAFYFFMIKDSILFVLKKSDYYGRNVIRATLAAQFVLWLTESYYALTPFYVLLVMVNNYQFFQAIDIRIKKRVRCKI